MGTSNRSTVAAGDLGDQAQGKSTAAVLHIDLDDELDLRSSQSQLDEAVGLAAAIDLEVSFAEVIALNRPRPATLMGPGKVEDLKTAFTALPEPPAVVIVNRALSPVQHRNLEKLWDLKVLDRTALILEIFGARAQTAEGRLQVELAHLTYQRSRLVRSWTHLERQRGGAGFLGGPGERQIESDRRALATKIDRIKEKLEQVRRTRNLQRAKRKRAPHPVIALVGYTNAGKSTLFNYLTQSTVMAEDLLFATLDPTMRAVDLPSGKRVILSDTVGFISALPTQLVAAFRATLEEVLEADIILHVRDAVHEDSLAQRVDVISVLKELGITQADQRPVIEVMNKVDLLGEEERATLSLVCQASESIEHPTISDPIKMPISAITGEGVLPLCAMVDRFITADHLVYTAHLSSEHGQARAFLFSHGDVLAEAQDEETIISVRMDEKSAGQFKKRFANVPFELSEGEEIFFKTANRQRTIG